MLYDSIPSKGVLKGLYFGLLIWAIKDVCAGSYLGLIGGGTNYAMTLISIGFPMWIIYGLALGYLYKKSD